MSYLILHRDRRDGLAVWWRENRSGYTNNIYEAGRYGFDEAESIRKLRGDDFPVHETKLAALRVRLVVSTEDGDNSAELRKLEQQS